MSRIASSAFLVACLFAIAGCKKAEFQEFVSADGHFKVLMPGKPKEQVQATGVASMKTYMIEEKNGAYMAAFSDMPIPANEPEATLQQRLDGSRDGCLRNTNAKLKKETKISLNGKYPGRDIEAELPDSKGLLHARIWLVKQRLYQVMVVGTQSWANSADAAKFLDSLTLTE